MRTEEIQQLLNKLPECGFAVKKSMHFVTLHFALGFFFSIFVGRLTTYSSNQSQTFGNVFTGKMSLFRDIIPKKLQSRGYQIFILLTTNSGLDSEGNVYIFEQKGKIKICGVILLCDE